MDTGCGPAASNRFDVREREPFLPYLPPSTRDRRLLVRTTSTTVGSYARRSWCPCSKPRPSAATGRFRDSSAAHSVEGSRLALCPNRWLVTKQTSARAGVSCVRNGVHKVFPSPDQSVLRSWIQAVCAKERQESIIISRNTGSVRRKSEQPCRVSSRI